MYVYRTCIHTHAQLCVRIYTHTNVHIYIWTMHLYIHGAENQRVSASEPTT